MPLRLSSSVFRLPCNQASRDPVGDVLRGTGQPLIFWKASSATVQGAAFIGDPSVAANLVTDWSNIVSVVLAMRIASATGALLFPEQVLPVAQVNTGLVYADWAAGLAQHFAFALTPDMLNVAAQQTVWLVIGVNTTNAGAFPIATSNNVKISDPGINNPGDENNPSVYTGWSKAEADGRYALAGSAGGGSFAGAITSVGDGAAGSLEDVPSAALALPTLRTVLLAATGELQDWVLAAGIDATDALHQRPTDFNPTTNPRVWTRKR